MTAEDHIIAYIESSAPHYKRLLELTERRKPGCTHGFMRPQGVAAAASNLVADTYGEMIANGSALRDDPYSPAELLRAAAMLCEWEQPE